MQAGASRLPFKGSSFHSVTCSHAFFELKGLQRVEVIEEVARILKDGGKFCLMEHTKPERLLPKMLFHFRLLFLGSGDAKTFLEQEESILGERFENIVSAISPTGRSKLITGKVRSTESGRDGHSLG